VDAKIGVLGGIGPESTKEFYGLLLEKMQHSGLIRENADYPHIIINSIPAPELTGREITEEQIAPYVEGVMELDSYGVDFIVVVCNTAHLFYDRLQKASEAPLIDLRMEVTERIKAS